MECINYEQQSQTEPLDVKLKQVEAKSESHYSMPQITMNAGGQAQASIEESIFYFNIISKELFILYRFRQCKKRFCI